MFMTVSVRVWVVFVRFGVELGLRSVAFAARPLQQPACQGPRPRKARDVGPGMAGQWGRPSGVRGRVSGVGARARRSPERSIGRDSAATPGPSGHHVGRDSVPRSSPLEPWILTNGAGPLRPWLRCSSV